MVCRSLFWPALTGVTDEHAIGKAFTESLPFTALLTVFATLLWRLRIVQHLSRRLFSCLASLSEHAQLTLHSISLTACYGPPSPDNVFVGTIYIEAKAAMEETALSAKQFELLAVAINTGTSLPSVATPMVRRHSYSTADLRAGAVNPSLLWPYGRGWRYRTLSLLT